MNTPNPFAFLNAWNSFTQNHPKFPAFLRALSEKGIQEGYIIEMSVKDTNGEVIETNIKVKPEDIELFNSLKGMM